MKKIFYCFVIFCCLNFIDANADEGILPHLISRNIVNEISPFIDEDTALVCFVDLGAVKDYHRFAKIVRKISESSVIPKRLQQNLSFIESALEKSSNESATWLDLTPLIESNVTHLYIILNMRDTKFGPYFVIPNVKENSGTAKNIELFFGIKPIADNKADNKEKQNRWAVYQNDYMIIGGSNVVLFNIAMIYSYPIEQYVFDLVMAETENAICGFNNLSNNEQQKYIKERFKNFKACKNENFCNGIEELDDCNMFKSVFLFPDAIIAWELLHLKKMEPPLNQTHSDFLNTTRKFMSFGIDTKQPKIKLTVQCTSKDNAVKFKRFIDDVWRHIANNYVTYLNLQNAKSPSDKDTPKPLIPDEWADAFVAFLPKQVGDKLILNIDKNFEPKDHTRVKNASNKKVLRE
jgi:hypothetical protein